MKQSMYRVVMGGLFLAAAAACDSDSARMAGDVSVAKNGRYIVVLKKSAAKEATRDGMDRVVNDVLADAAVTPERISNRYKAVFNGFAAELSADQYRNILNDERVAYVEPDHVVQLAPIQAMGKPGSGGGTTGQTTPWGITRVGGAVSGAGKTAWVIDSGVDLDHPDLNVDVARSRTFFTSGRDAGSADDGNGHGTHVAGTIGARNNTIGVVGVAAGATIVGVKVLDSRGSGAYSIVIAGVDYVAANAAPGDVANMSLGGPVSQALDDAVVAAASKGILFALAAGNESVHAGNSSPARVNHPNVYTVSAVSNTDTFASFSNFGNPPVDFAAPGVSINSTWKGGGYNTISGTSMASPHVAGILLIRGGAPATSGTAKNDPDGNADPIARL